MSPKMLYCLPLHHLGTNPWWPWEICIFGLYGILVIYFVSMDEAFDVIVVEMILCLTAVFFNVLASAGKGKISSGISCAPCG